jgi:hypothetical protein
MDKQAEIQVLETQANEADHESRKLLTELETQFGDIREIQSVPHPLTQENVGENEEVAAEIVGSVAHATAVWEGEKLDKIARIDMAKTRRATELRRRIEALNLAVMQKCARVNQLRNEIARDELLSGVPTADVKLNKLKLEKLRQAVKNASDADRQAAQKRLNNFEIKMRLVEIYKRFNSTAEEFGKVMAELRAFYDDSTLSDSLQTELTSCAKFAVHPLSCTTAIPRVYFADQEMPHENDGLSATVKANYYYHCSQILS